MSRLPGILAIAGSTRKDSVNGKLLRIAADGARDAGAEVTLLDLRKLPLPIYDGDLEDAEGLPANAVELKRILCAHDGLLIASPEYNSSVTALLKNSIDWATRPSPGEPPLVAFKGKVAGIMAASPGGLGGMRGLVTLRSILGNIGVVVLPDQVTLPNAAKAFTAEGKLADAGKQTAAENLGGSLAQMLTKLISE